MNNRILTLAVAVVTVMSTAACKTRDNNSITGSTGYTSVSLSSNPSSFTVVRGDSAAFTPTASIEPQNVVIANGSSNMTFAFANPAIAEINGSGYVQGDAVGSTTLTITYADVNHSFAPTTLTVPVTVTGVP